MKFHMQKKKLTPPRESTVKSKVINYSKELGWITYPFTSPGNLGVPDTLFMKLGVVIFVEFKRPGEVPRKSQINAFNKIRSQNIPVYVVDSVLAGKTVFDRFETAGVF